MVCKYIYPHDILLEGFSMPLSRRRFLTLLGGIAGAAIIAGAGAYYMLGGSRSPQVGITTSPTTRALSGKITVLGRSAYHENINKYLITLFLSKYPGVQVEYVAKGYSDEYQLLVLSMRNSSPDYDALYIDEPWIPLMLKNSWLEPLDNPDLDGYPEYLKNWATRGGKVYALPITGNANFLFYRSDILSDLGEKPPESWDDVLRIAKKVKSKYTDTGVKIYGFGASATKGTGASQDTFPALLYPFGGSYFGSDGVTPTLNSREAVEALSFLKDLLNYSHPRTTQWTSLTEYSDAILRGEIAMGIVWNGWISDIDNPSKSSVVGKIEIMPYPRQRISYNLTHSGVWYYGVSVFSRNKAAAMEYVKTVTSKESQKLATINAGLPASRVPVYGDPDVKSKLRLASKFTEIMSVVRPLRTSPAWPDMADSVGNYIYLGLRGEMSPEDAISRAHEEMVKVSKSSGLI
jgi:multiple sugar transport system substrate-binding protein